MSTVPMTPPSAGERQAPVPTFLVSGFLGAGKTTFILDQLKEPTPRVAVLVNEFGTLGIDGDLIRESGGIQVVEMPGGCICCSQKEGLLESIRAIVLQIAPERLLIEPSGVAETSELLKVLADPSLAGLITLQAVIAVLDAETFLEFSEPEAFGLFFLDQVRCADLLVVNKADLVSPEVLEQVEERVRRLAPGALVVRTQYCRLPGELPPAAGPSGTGSAGACPPHGAGHHSAATSPVALGMDCLSLVPAKTFTAAELDAFLHELTCGGFGRVLRAKGFLPLEAARCVSLQFVSGQASADPFVGEVSPRVTLIGFELRERELRRALSSRMSGG